MSIIINNYIIYQNVNNNHNLPTVFLPVGTAKFIPKRGLNIICEKHTVLVGNNLNIIWHNAAYNI